MIELKGSPVASAPIFVSTSSGLYWFIVRMAVGTFDTDSMPNLYSVSPAAIISPSGRQTAMPNRSEGTLAR